MNTEPIHILSLGAGVQSSTLALMAAAGEITPMPECAIFADTQAEPASVYRWLDWLEKQLPFPVHRVTAGSLIEDITTIRQKKDGTGQYVHSGVPAFIANPDGSDGIIPRQCTVTFKIEPIRRAMKSLFGVNPREKSIRIIQWIGISLEEIHRMKPNRDKWCENRWPLIDAGMKRHDCLRWLDAHGFPRPARSACFFCPYKSNAEWRRLRDEESEYWHRAIALEKEFSEKKRACGVRGLPFFHRSRVPLADVDLSTDADRGQPDLFGNECEGMCGV